MVASDSTLLQISLRAGAFGRKWASTGRSRMPSFFLRRITLGRVCCSIAMAAYTGPLAMRPQRRYHPGRRALRLSARTQDFHSCKRGSTPLGRAIIFIRLLEKLRGASARHQLKPKKGQGQLQAGTSRRNRWPVARSTRRRSARDRARGNGGGGCRYGPAFAVPRLRWISGEKRSRCAARL